MKDKVELVKGRLEETKLPYDSFQFIVSEWMGYFLLFEVGLLYFYIVYTNCKQEFRKSNKRFNNFVI